MSVRMPIGVVGAITPWNFPIAIPSWKLAPALVCGNTVVLKPARTRRSSPSASSSCSRGRPAGGRRQPRARLRRGGGRPARAPPGRPGDHLHRLARDRRPRHEGAADALKHVHLELGGKNAIIVLDDADLDLAVDGIVWSAFGTSGQRCTAASRVIVQAGVYDELSAGSSPAPSGCASGRLGPGHRPRPGDQPRGAREDPLLHGDRRRRGREAAHRRRGRHRRRPRRRASTTGRRSSPTSSRRCGSRRRRSSGRRPALIPVADFDEAVRVANGIRYGLSSSIFTRDVNKAFRAMRDLAGRDHVHQRRHDRRRGAPAVRRHEGHRQRPPRGRARRRSTSSRSGSRSTSTTRAACSARRSTTSSSPLRPESRQGLQPRTARSSRSVQEHLAPIDAARLDDHKAWWRRSQATSSCAFTRHTHLPVTDRPSDWASAVASGRLSTIEPPRRLGRARVGEAVGLRRPRGVQSSRRAREDTRTNRLVEPTGRPNRGDSTEARACSTRRPRATSPRRRASARPPTRRRRPAGPDPPRAGSTRRRDAARARTAALRRHRARMSLTA